MNNIDETNIVIFRLIQEKFNLSDKIFFTIDDGSPNGIKNKDIKIRLIDLKNIDNEYKLILFNTTISELIKNIYNKNITEIDIRFSSCAMDLYQIDNFPNFIKKICLDFKFNCEILKKLPEDLEYLDIRYSPEEIKTELNNLPNKLKVLKMSDINYNLPLDNLPSSLEKLVLSLKNKYNHNLDNLPSSLNFLEINLLNDKNCICVLNNLPESIKEIRLKNYNGFEINKYPKKLKTLELCSKEEITNIPENVKIEYKKYENIKFYRKSK